MPPYIFEISPRGTLLLIHSKSRTAGPVTGIGFAVTYRIDFQVVGVAEIIFPVVTGINAAPYLYFWSYRYHLPEYSIPEQDYFFLWFLFYAGVDRVLKSKTSTLWS